MRHFVAFALALAVGLSITDTAEAKKPKPEPTEQAAEGGEEMSLEMKTTGIADVDNVFTAANAPLTSIRDAKTKLDSLNTNLATALGLPAGTPFTDALNDLKAKGEGKIQMAMDAQGMPKLSASDAVPANVQTAIDAVNNGVSDVMAAVAALSAVPDQCKGVAAQAAEITPDSFKGASPTQIPKMMKTVQGNIKVLGMAPDEVTSLVDSATQLKDTLTSTFTG